MTKKSPKKSAAKGKSAAKPKAASPMPVEMEALMREVIELISEEEITKTDVDALLTSLKGPLVSDALSDADADARDAAQQIAFDAMEAESAAQARKLAKRALELDPDCVDALVVLTDLDARTPRETIEGLRKAVEAGERSLGAKFIRENTGHFWMLIETRPWMRAMEQLAGLLQDEGISLDAIKIYERMLTLNPNDNQGVRDPLLGLYLETDNLQGAERLLMTYEGDGSANFAWSRVLTRLLAGDHDGARAALKRARKVNQHVELFLTGCEPLPKHLPEMYSRGSEEEAVLCLDNLSRAWTRHKEAMMWVLDRLAEDGGLWSAPDKSLLKKIPAATKKVQ